MAEYIYQEDSIGEGTYNYTLVGELVRCEKCIHWQETDFVDGLGYGECDNGVIKKSVWTNETWFCKDGERRADDD